MHTHARTHTHIYARESVIAVQACGCPPRENKHVSEPANGIYADFQVCNDKIFTTESHILYKGKKILDKFIEVFQVLQMYLTYQMIQMIHIYQRIWSFIAAEPRHRGTPIRPLYPLRSPRGVTIPFWANGKGCLNLKNSVGYGTPILEEGWVCF